MGLRPRECVSAPADNHRVLLAITAIIQTIIRAYASPFPCNKTRIHFFIALALERAVAGTASSGEGANSKDFLAVMQNPVGLVMRCLIANIARILR